MKLTGPESKNYVDYTGAPRQVRDLAAENALSDAEQALMKKHGWKHEDIMILREMQRKMFESSPGMMPKVTDPGYNGPVSNSFGRVVDQGNPNWRP